MTEHLWIAASSSAVSAVSAVSAEDLRAPKSLPAGRAWGEALLAEASRRVDPEHSLAAGVRHRAVFGSLLPVGPTGRQVDSVHVLVNASRAWVGREDTLARLCSHSGWRTMSAALVEQGFPPSMIEEVVDPSRPAEQCGDADPAGVQEFLRDYMPSPLLEAIAEYFGSDTARYLSSWRPLAGPPLDADADDAWVVVAPSEAIVEVRLG